MCHRVHRPYRAVISRVCTQIAPQITRNLRPFFFGRAVFSSLLLAMGKEEAGSLLATQISHLNTGPAPKFRANFAEFRVARRTQISQKKSRNTALGQFTMSKTNKESSAVHAHAGGKACISIGVLKSGQPTRNSALINAIHGIFECPTATIDSF